MPEGTLPDPTALRLFLDSVPPPPRLKSPFVRTSTITGPGHLSEPLVVEHEGQQPFYTPLESWPEGGGHVLGYAKMTLQKRLADPISMAISSAERDIPRENMMKTGNAARISPAPGTENGTASWNSAQQSYEPTTQAEQLALQETFDALPSDISRRFLFGFSSPVTLH